MRSSRLSRTSFHSACPSRGRVAPRFTVGQKARPGVLAIVLALAPLHPTQHALAQGEVATKPAACLPASVEASPSLRLSGCAPLDPHSVDIPAVKRSLATCPLGDLRVSGTLVKDDLHNPKLRVSRGTEVVAVWIPEPRATEPVTGGGLGPKLVCDPIGRIYFIHGHMGYVSAFDPMGRELWRVDLPGFRPVFPLLPEGKRTAEDYIAAKERGGSFALQIMTSGEYVAVGFSTGQRGVDHVVVHRSGVVVGTVGPWDGFLYAARENGWRVLLGGGLESRFYVPDREAQLSVGDTRIASTIHHALAWLLPRPMDKELKLRCAGRSEDELVHWLGDRYVEADARRAKELLLSAGGDAWFARVLAREPIRKSLENFDPLSREWIANFQRALLEAGVDAELAAALRK